MKQALEQLLRSARTGLEAAGTIPAGAGDIEVQRTRDSRHGDFSCNLALTLAAAARMKPRELAQLIVEGLPASPLVDHVEIAGPGFINFFLRRDAWFAAIPDILERGERYGHAGAGTGQNILLEFVSANPTGPLHIGHGRGAAYGAALGNLLAAAGHQVTREYYVNDTGRQMDILALSIWLRYLELCGQSFQFPDGAYRGGYVRDVARKLEAADGHALVLPAQEVVHEPDPALDADERLDQLVSRARQKLGAARFERVFRLGLEDILADIRGDLSEFGVNFDVWTSEISLIETGKVEECMRRLRDGGNLYEKDGATWFRSSAFGDEKDRVLVRDNGQRTYFTADIAHHVGKFERGFDRAINIWGADHHGYIPRVKAALAALGRDPGALEVLIVQFATLYRGGEKVQMSTRSGEFVTLRELREEVGNDASRFFYVTRKSEQHLDFDLDLAKSESSDNPVYYIQYAHARICSVMRQLQEKRLEFVMPAGAAALGALGEPQESALLTTLTRFPELIQNAAAGRDPHLVAAYLRELANDFHVYYNTHQFLVDDATLRNARLALILAARQVIRNGLAVLGVTAPETM
jgi:arginyl-tRNA synthetase